MMIGKRFYILAGALLLVAAPSFAQTPGPPPGGTAAAPAAAPPPTPIVFDEAVAKAATDLFTKASASLAQGKRDLVIDPLIDGVTGAQSVSSQDMGRRLAGLVQGKYPVFDLKPFTSDAVDKRPIVLIGTLTAINNAGQADGARDAYRICLALADLQSNTILAKGVARATPASVDPTPTASFADSPVWTKDAATGAYVKTCQGSKVGDPIDPVYSGRLRSAALISDAVSAYDSKRYRDAAQLYQTASAAPGGDQLRVYSGLYLSSAKLNHRAEAAQAFSRLIEYGLKNNSLAVKFLFRPGTTQFGKYTTSVATYDMWMRQIADRATAQKSCLEITGHTSPTGARALNDRLSALRAEMVKYRLEDLAPELGRKVIAGGVGSRQTIVGTGRDDASDALDRRVEFKVLPDCST